jgi:predicted Zn-dependent peptidase
MTGFHELDWPYTRLLENDAQIAALTLEQVNTAWRKYVDANRFVWGLFADQAKVK